MTIRTQRPVSILLVEDDKIDAKAFMRAYQAAGICNPITLVHDGVEGWEELKGLRTGTPFPRPAVLILDINMPRMSGIELLQKIRDDEQLRDLVVFMLTTSSDDSDMLAAYDLNVAGYMLKTDLENGFGKTVELLQNYLRTIEFPATSDAGVNAA